MKSDAALAAAAEAKYAALKVDIENSKVKYESDFLTMENKLRHLILGLLDKPVNLMKEQHDSIELLKTTGGKN